MSDEGRGRMRRYRGEHTGDQCCRQVGLGFDTANRLMDFETGRATTYISTYLGTVLGAQYARLLVGRYSSRQA